MRWTRFDADFRGFERGLALIFDVAVISRYRLTKNLRQSVCNLRKSAPKIRFDLTLFRVNKKGTRRCLFSEISVAD